jgi:acetoacetate decarboxylase
MAHVTGFMFPRSATGRSSLVPSPPWHYSGTTLTVEYRTDPAAVAELLPDPLEPADDDPGAVAVIWADWQSCSDSFAELLDPVRSQYMETFVVVRCKYRGQHYSRCVYIWVDKDFAMVRGHHQGYPKKLGELYVTRPVTVGRAGPRLEAGGRFGATCAAYGRRLMDATFTITGPSETAGFVNALPMIHNRYFPAIEGDGTDSLDELVTMSGYDGELGRCFTGTATLELHDSPVEELTRLAPQEMIAGYWRELATSWRAGTTLERDRQPVEGGPGEGEPGDRGTGG